MRQAPQLKPRDYQLEALDWALQRRGAVICMPTGTGKTLIAGLWARELLRSGKARRVLFLEPTRFLVEQIAGYLRRVLGLPAAPLHGSLPPLERRRAWSSRIVVATPEIVVAEWRAFEAQGFDAVVVDECHHTTGKDAYRQVMEGHRFHYRLGLSALIPGHRRREIEGLIGEIRCWPWTHPSITRYMPAWAAEVYEAPLNRWERGLYEALEDRWARASGPGRALLGSALRWLSRDGAEAVRETYWRSPRLRGLLEGLEDLLFDERVRPAHKLPHLDRALQDHEGYEKAIVFVDRVIIARIIAEHHGPGTALLLGRKHAKPWEALEKARSPSTKLIVATSAGEEGIDLPETDLLIVWSATSSPLRLVQRLGRILRPRHGMAGQKYVVFLVTPETVDVDSLLDGITMAEKAGVHVNVSSETVRRLITLSRRRRILQLLYHQPLPPDIAAKALGAPRERVEAGLRWLAMRGLVGYIHTSIGRIYFPQDDTAKLYQNYRQYLAPHPAIKATVTINCAGKRLAARNAVYSKAAGLLLEALGKCELPGPIRASIMIPLNGMIRMVNRVYSLRLSTRQAAKAIADNIYTY